MVMGSHIYLLHTVQCPITNPLFLFLIRELVMLCRQWGHLQCFPGRTGRTHGTTAGYCVAEKRAQYHNIRPFKTNLRSQILLPSP